LSTTDQHIPLFVCLSTNQPKKWRLKVQALTRVCHFGKVFETQIPIWSNFNFSRSTINSTRKWGKLFFYFFPLTQNWETTFCWGKFCHFCCVKKTSQNCKTRLHPIWTTFKMWHSKKFIKLHFTFQNKQKKVFSFFYSNAV
jgi:hypothetical protein